jgi:hypothetical protein
MGHDYFHPTPEERVVVLVESKTLRRAERLIESCEGCNPNLGSLPMGVCEQKVRLMEAYNIATIAYSEIACIQYKKIGLVSKEEYEALKEDAAIALETCNDARKKLERHLAEHHC